LNNVINNIKNRRSIRRYLDKPISKEIVEQIIDCGIYAPSSHNSQPWNFTVLGSKKVIDELSDEISRWYSSLLKIGKPLSFIKKVKSAVNAMRKRVDSEKDLFFYHAPVVIIIHARSGEFSRQDCACAAQNMLLAARSLDIGSCWIGFCDIALNRSKKLRKKVNIPVSHKVIGTIAFGYTEKFPASALPRKKFSIDWIN
jgi:nitroreductase